MDVWRVLQCRRCGGRIGVYEPVVVTDAAGHRVTSLTREPDLLQTAGDLLHTSCAMELGLQVEAPGSS